LVEKVLPTIFSGVEDLAAYVEKLQKTGYIFIKDDIN
jgi:hypothetical protein